MWSKNKKIAYAFFLFLILFGIMQFTVPNIIGFDGHFHIKIADLIKEKGFFKEFPYTQNSILSERYADIQVLFRIILIPFTYLGLNFGAKIAAIIFASICFTVFYWFLAENKISYAFYWTLLYLFSSVALMQRFLLTRQMPLAIALILITIHFLQKRKYIFLGLASFVFALLYGGFVFQLLIILLFFVLDKVFSKKFDFRIIIYSYLGAALGLLINPYFPNNLYLLYIQIFKVNLNANLFNVEWKPWPFLDFIKNNIIVLFILATPILVLIKNKKINRTKLFYLSLSIFFFLYTIKTRRMQEYLVPFAVLSASFYLNEIIEKMKKDEFSKYVKTAAVIFLIVIASANFMLMRKAVINSDFLYNYESCAIWMQGNIPKNSLVFINAYAFPYLFMKNSDLIYTHGIDLTYSYLHDEGEFQRYMGILRGTIKTKIDLIKRDYNPDYLFVGKLEQDTQLYDFIMQNKENYKAAFEDKWCAVLEVK